MPCVIRSLTSWRDPQCRELGCSQRVVPTTSQHSQAAQCYNNAENSTSPFTNLGFVLSQLERFWRPRLRIAVSTPRVGPSICEINRIHRDFTNSVDENFENFEEEYSVLVKLKRL